MVEQTASQKPVEPVRPEKRASWLRDMLYTLNHAISCLFTDSIIQPLVGTAVHEVEHNENLEKSDRWKWIKKPMRWLGGTLEHEHGHEKEHKLTFSGLLKESGHWFGGEIIGDLSAVPITATIARFFPGLMKGLRSFLEPLMGWFFQKGAARDAELWAKKEGVDPHGPEAAEKKRELYEYEASHFGHIALWNTFSTVINVQSQYWWRSRKAAPHEHKASLGELYFGKIFGLAISNLMLISARALKPSFFQRNEEKVGEVTGRLFGAQERQNPLRCQEPVEEHRKEPACGSAKPEKQTDKNWVATTTRDGVPAQAASIT